MPGLPTVVLAAFEPKDNQLLALSVPNDLGRDLGALHVRRAGVHLLAVTRQKNLVEVDLGPRLPFQMGDPEDIARLGFELLAGGLENRVCHGAVTLTRMRSWVKMVKRR